MKKLIIIILLLIVLGLWFAPNFTKEVVKDAGDKGGEIAKTTGAAVLDKAKENEKVQELLNSTDLLS